MFLKNITIFLLISFFWLGSVFAADEWMSMNPTSSELEWKTSSTTTPDKNTSHEEVVDLKLNPVKMDWTKSSESAQFNCTPGKDSLCSEQFKISTSQFSPGGKSFVAQWWAKKTVDAFFTTLIKKLMIALWSLALLIMVVWAWFMIFAMWKDDNLNKWKTIFKSWLIALAIALSSYFIVSFLSFILYS